MDLRGWKVVELKSEETAAKPAGGKKAAPPKFAFVGPVEAKSQEELAAGDGGAIPIMDGASSPWHRVRN